MMMHVALEDAAGARSLAEQLRGVLDAASVSLDVGRPEVAVELEPEPDKRLVQVVNAVCAWLERGGQEGARLRLGSRSHSFPRQHGISRVKRLTERHGT